MNLNIFSKEVNNILSQFTISHERLIQISNDIQLEFTVGLNNSDKNSSSIAMLPSYVPALPDGTGFNYLFYTFFLIYLIY